MCGWVPQGGDERKQALIHIILLCLHHHLRVCMCVWAGGCGLKQERECGWVGGCKGGCKFA